MKHVLILGGTHFIGRNLVERLEANPKYALTIFSRGLTNPDIFPDIPRITGDRDTDDIQQLKQQSWDYVIDLSAYYPDSVEKIIEAVGEVNRYILVSSCSAYDNNTNRSEMKSESTALLKCSESQRTDTSPATYGERKAACERALEASGLDHIILRPALVYGAYDPTDRFYYWLYHVKKSSKLLLPNGGNSTFSSTYVHDLVDTLVASLTIEEHNNCYNVISRPRTSIKQIVDCASTLLKTRPEYVTASSAFLTAERISQWTLMPLWLDSEHFTYSNERLLDDFNLRLANFENSVSETIHYFDVLDWPKPTYGISEATRQALLAKLGPVPG